MPSKYKLTYFDGRGLAEPIRFLFLYMGEEFEDNRMSTTNPDIWAKLKPTMPFGKVPLLEFDGKRYTQSIALYRYLGNKAKLAGDNDLEELQVDIIGDVLVDLGNTIPEIHRQKDEKRRKALEETLIKETLPFYLKKLEEIAKENDGYLANKKLSWADFMFASIAENFIYMYPEVSCLDDFPTLQALKDKILTHPKIKSYAENRPELPF